MKQKLAAALFSIWVAVSLTGSIEAQATRGVVELNVTDQATGGLISCRFHLKDHEGKPVFADGLPKWRDHFVCSGKAKLELPGGPYTYQVERGPEYKPATGSITLSSETNQSVPIKLSRLADLASEGWWSGDLHVHRPIKDMELLMQAEDLHVAPVITWWNNQNLWSNQPAPAKVLVGFDHDRFYQVMAGEDERAGGALLYFGLNQPLAIAGAAREYPSSMKFLEGARRQPGVWIDIEKPFWWDVPVWLASGQVDSIGLANNHMCRDQMYESEAWGKPRDAAKLPPPLGNGFWTQEIYYHILNCGLRIPPSAGSASGVLPNPVGYNRVYVHLGKSFSYEKWWNGLKAGRSFVSNGPLLRCTANGEPPGHVFTVQEGQPLNIQITADLSTTDPISAIEIIKNGNVERKVPMDNWKRSGDLGALPFDTSGWFLVRVIADNPKTFRFASTAPYYVEIGAAKKRISKVSAQFFLDWVRERMSRLELTDHAQREEVLRYHHMAERFWSDLLARSNAE